MRLTYALYTPSIHLIDSHKNLAMRSKPQATVSLTVRHFGPEPTIN